MIIKRYFAPNIRQAIRMVRDEQGPDAVILSNQKVRGGVEIVAAVDYDESMFHREPPAAPDAGQGMKPGAGPAAERHAAPAMQPRTDDLPGSGPEAAVGKVSGREAVTAEPAAGRKRRQPEVIWSQDPALVEMRAELQQLRRMLEDQLSGLAWGELARRCPQRAQLIKRLVKLGLGAELSRRLVAEVPEDVEGDELWLRVLGRLARRLPVPAGDLLEAGGVIALVGPTGVGKTTTVAKLAARYALRYGKRHVAMVTIDNYRVGAFEQLRTYGRILDIPVRLAGDHAELREILDDFCDRSLILVDTVGMSQHDHNLLQQKTLLDGDGGKMKKILLLSATGRLSGLEDVIRSFGIFNPESCIVTKLDESTSLGAVFDRCIRHDLPIAYVCDGQRVPEDIHPARPATLVEQGVKILERAADKIEDELLLPGFGKEVANACL